MVIAAGNTLIDQLISVHDLPPHGGKRSGRCIAALPGGGAANTIATAAALGAETRFYTALGDDDYGQAMMRAFAELGTDLHAERCKRTPLSLVFIDAERERTLVTLRGDVEPSPDLIEGELAGPDDLFLVNIGDDAARAAFASRCSGRLVLPGRHLEAELEAGGRWHVILTSRDETRRPSEEELRRIGCEFFVMTAGGEGGEWWAGDGWRHYSTPYVPVEEIIDACGAGDAFAGGLLAGLDAGLDPELAIAQGAEQGAKCMRRRGAWPEGPWLPEGGLEPLLPH